MSTILLAKTISVFDLNYFSPMTFNEVKSVRAPSNLLWFDAIVKLKYFHIVWDSFLRLYPAAMLLLVR